MSESKRNKNRKSNLEKFKQLQKTKIKSMKQEVPQMKPFRQIPVWKEDAKFELNGAELMTLQQFFGVFMQPVKVMQDIFSRHIQNGTIEIKYQDEKGEEIPKEEIQNQLKLLSEYYQSLEKQPESNIETQVDVKPVKSKSKLKAV